MGNHAKPPYAVDAVVSDHDQDIILDYKIDGREFPILVASTYGGEDDDTDWRDGVATAKFIVRACNAHDDLLAACEKMLHHIDDVADETDLMECRAAISAAIAKARGQQ